MADRTESTEPTERRWVMVPGVVGWTLEHDPETESGIAPVGKYRND